MDYCVLQQFILTHMCTSLRTVVYIVCLIYIIIMGRLRRPTHNIRVRIIPHLQRPGSSLLATGLNRLATVTSTNRLGEVLNQNIIERLFRRNRQFHFF